MRITEKKFSRKNRDAKGQGARMRIRRSAWLKKLRVAVSTRACMPSGSSQQNSRTNFVDLINNTCSFKEFVKISTKTRPIKVSEEQ
jgi:hypothetical protein